MNTGRAAGTSKNVGPLRTLLDLKAPAFVPVTISASKNGSGNSQTDLANKDPNLLKSSQVAGDLQPRLLTHPPQAPERCQANLLYCETRKLEMRSTAQIWWAQANRGEKRCCSVAFSPQASESGSLLFRTKKAMSMWHASRSRLLHLRITATVPKHRERDIYHHGPPIPQQAYAIVPKVGHPQKPAHTPPTSGHLLRPAVAKSPSFQTYPDCQTSRGCVPSVLRSPNTRLGKPATTRPGRRS